MMTNVNIIKNNPRSVTYINEEYFIKCSENVSLKNEALELQRCKAVMTQNRHILVPEMFSYESSSNCLTTKYICSTENFFNILWNGTSIIGKLKRNGINIPIFIERMHELGLWLKDYHISSHYPDFNVDSTTNIVNAFRKKIEKLKSYKLFNEYFLDRILFCFIPSLENLKSLTDSPISRNEFCQIHGDFIAYNMLVDLDWNIHVLDFGDTRIGSPFEDICRFYELFWVIGRTNPFRKKIIDKALSVFIKAYGLPKNINSNPIFRSIRAFNAITHCLAEYEQRQKSSNSMVSNFELKLITYVSLFWVAKDVNFPVNKVFLLK